MNGDPTAGARRRHPSARGSRADLQPLAARLAAGFRHLHLAHPEVAAAAVLARGASGRTIEGFAQGHGLAPEIVASLEAGEVPCDEVPVTLRLLTPLGAVHARLVDGLPSR
jgi:hypothetical protein